MPAARLANSWKAGRRNDSGRNFTGAASSVMKMRHISAVLMPLASPAAMNEPELTPT